MYGSGFVRISIAYSASRLTLSFLPSAAVSMGLLSFGLLVRGISIGAEPAIGWFIELMRRRIAAALAPPAGIITDMCRWLLAVFGEVVSTRF